MAQHYRPVYHKCNQRLYVIPGLFFECRVSSDCSSKDAFSAGIIKGEEFLISSPNHSPVLAPPLGNRAVTLQADLRFGEDDPLLWPQLFHPELPHLACLRLPPIKGDGQDTIMWDMLSVTDLWAEESVVVGISRLKNSKLRRLLSPIMTLLDASAHLDDPLPIVNRLRFILKRFVFDVELTRGDWLQKSLRIRETQRAYLELQACVDYSVRYKPAMRLDDKEIEGSPDVMHLTYSTKIRGAFTFDPMVCEWLFRANIPVWFIRPVAGLQSINMFMSSKDTQPLRDPEISKHRCRNDYTYLVTAIPGQWWDYKAETAAPIFDVLAQC